MRKLILGLLDTAGSICVSFRLFVFVCVCVCVRVCLCMCVNMNGVSFCSGSMQVIAVWWTKQRGKQCSENDQRAISSKQSIILLSGMFCSGMWNPHLYK